MNIFRRRQFNKKLKRVTDLWVNAISVCEMDVILEKDERIIKDDAQNLKDLTDGCMISLNALIKMYPEMREVVEGIKTYIHTTNSHYISEAVKG